MSTAIDTLDKSINEREEEMFELMRQKEYAKKRIAQIKIELIKLYKLANVHALNERQRIKK